MKKGSGIHDYSDIIDLPRPEPKTHSRMPIGDRAAQFMPFAALTGYSSVIAEISRTTEKKIILDESEKAELNRKLIMLKREQELASKVRIQYFEPDSKKEGGRYISLTASIRKIDEFAQVLFTEDGLDIPFDNILSINF